MPAPSRSSPPSPALVALASWLVPGGGYWLLGRRGHALAVGITVCSLFILGLLIAGVRVLEVPGYGDHGKPLIVALEQRGFDRTDAPVYYEHLTEDPESGWREIGPVMRVHPVDEIRNKPWTIAQIMTGPLAILSGAGSVAASRPNADGEPRGARSHAKINEIGVLYTAIAGMLNLLAIIDASYRALQGDTENGASDAAVPVTGSGGAR